MQQYRPLFRLLGNVRLSTIQKTIHTEHKVVVNGIGINIVQTGNGPESVLLMSGALGCSWTDFKPQIEKLPQLLSNHTIIAWDPPGYGKSIPPKRQFGIEFLKNDATKAVELMCALKRPKFSIMGWSDGGITALIMAANYAENVKKLIIWGAGAYLNAAELKMLESLRNVNKWSLSMREPMEQVYGKERFAELWSEWVDAMISFNVQRNGDLCRNEVSQIKIPTLILHGKKDPMIAAEHIPYLREHIKQAKYYEFPDGKHNIHLRYADEFNKVVTDFILEK